MNNPTMRRTQVVRPAGAGHETLYVVLISLLIVVLAATVVWMRGEREDEQTIASHQVDARRDLTAAEQGIYTDLRVAFDEIQLLREETAAVPGVDALAAEGLPPFVVDAGSQSRGSHQWLWLQTGAYLGRSQDLQLAGSFLLILPGGQQRPGRCLATPRQRRRHPGRLRPGCIDRRWLAAGGQPLRRRGHPRTPSLNPRNRPCSAPHSP